MPESRRALVELSLALGVSLSGGKGDPVEVMEPVEAERPLTRGCISPSSCIAAGFWKDQ